MIGFLYTGGMQLVNGGDLDSALGLLNGPGVDANGSLEKTRGRLVRFKVEDGWSWILSIHQVSKWYF